MVLSSDSWAVFTLMPSPAKAYTKAGQIPPSAGYAPDAVLSTFLGTQAIYGLWGQPSKSLPVGIRWSL